MCIFGDFSMVMHVLMTQDHCCVLLISSHPRCIHSRAMCIAVHDALSIAFGFISTRAKGVVPLPGVKTRAHADEIVGCLGWELVQEDVDILDAAHDVSY